MYICFNHKQLVHRLFKMTSLNFELHNHTSGGLEGILETSLSPLTPTLRIVPPSSSLLCTSGS